MSKSTSSTGATNIVQLPLAFVRSGYVNPANGYVGNTGCLGDYWSRTSYSPTNAYLLTMNPTLVYPSGNWNRYGGFSLRCRYTLFLH